MAIPVSSDEKPTNPVRALVTDEISDNSRRLTILERSGNQSLEERVAAAEAEIVTIKAFLGI